ADGDHRALHSFPTRRSSDLVLNHVEMRWSLVNEVCKFQLRDEPLVGSPAWSRGGPMLRLITSQGVQVPAGDALGMIYGGSVDTTRTWVETSALLVTECIGRPFDRYFMIVITNDVNEDDIGELHRLEAEVGKKL